MISIIGATHTGQRERNEDCYVADSSLGLGLVADGMGGYACGDLASQIVQQTVVEAVSNNEGLKEAIARAHSSVKSVASEDTEKQGMGSTAIGLKIYGLDYEIAWVGDSRAYLWTPGEGELRQITRDHSYVETLVSSGAISDQEALEHPNRNLITQAVGVSPDSGLVIDIIQGRLAPGQQLLLCSDGLVDEVNDADIAQLLNSAQSADQALTELIDAAVTAGGRDNITVVIATAEQGLNVDKAPVVPDAVRTTRISDNRSRLVTPGIAISPESMLSQRLSGKRRGVGQFILERVKSLSSGLALALLVSLGFY